MEIIMRNPSSAWATAVIVILADSLMLYLIISVNGAGASIINIVVFFVFQFDMLAL